MENLDCYKKCCFSGYRPSKFPFKLNNDDIDFQIFQKRLFTTVKNLIDDGCRTFYSGMAMGFDIIAAEAVLYYRGKVPGIELICAVPFENQQIAYPESWKQRYDFILAVADEVVYTSQNYHSGCYQVRNKYMVDNSDYIVTWYDGQAGGTRNTIKYAQKKSRYIINLNINYFEELNSKQMNIDI